MDRLASRVFEDGARSSGTPIAPTLRKTRPWTRAGGRVSVSVATEAERAKAEQVTLKVGGVNAVKNLLQVVPNAQRKTVERADADIKESVEAAFKANRRIVESGIKVASVNKGVVLLSGKTKSLEAHYESVQVAHAVRGVRRVSSEVEVDSPTS